MAGKLARPQRVQRVHDEPVDRDVAHGERTVHAGRARAAAGAAGARALGTRRVRGADGALVLRLLRLFQPEHALPELLPPARVLSLLPGLEVLRRDRVPPA